MAKFHLNLKSGAVSPCAATIRECPLGESGLHFDRREEAHAHYDQAMSSKVIPIGMAKSAKSKRTHKTIDPKSVFLTIVGDNGEELTEAWGSDIHEELVAGAYQGWYYKESVDQDVAVTVTVSPRGGVTVEEGLESYVLVEHALTDKQLERAEEATRAIRVEMEKLRGRYENTLEDAYKIALDELASLLREKTPQDCFSLSRRLKQVTSLCEEAEFNHLESEEEHWSHVRNGYETIRGILTQSAL